MSAEQSIASLIAELKSIASGYSSSASSLVGSSVAGLKTPVSGVGPFSFSANRGATVSVSEPSPPNIEIRSFSPPAIPDLGQLTELTKRFLAAPPSLDSIQSFSGTTTELYRPNLNPPQRPVLSTEPNFAIVQEPLIGFSIAKPTRIQVDPISQELDVVDKPEFDKYEDPFEDSYRDGLKRGAVDINKLHSFLEDQVFADNPKISHLTSILSGRELAVPDEWEDHQYQQKQQSLMAERLTALSALDAKPTSITGLPTGDRAYANLLLEANIAQESIKSASEVATSRRALEVKHTQWALNLAEQWVDTGFSLLLTAIKGGLDAASTALESSSSALDAALKVYDIEKKKAALYMQYVDLELNRLDLLMQVEKTKLEPLKFTVESNKLQAEYSEINSQMYQATMQIVELRIKKYESQIAYLVTTKQTEMLKLDEFDAYIKEYEASVKYYSAQQELYKARISGDIALAKAEAEKVKIYSAQAKAFSADAKALGVKALAQATNSKAQIEAYNEKTQAQLTQLRSYNESMQLAVRALLAMYDAEAKSRETEIVSQAATERAALDDAFLSLNEQQVAAIEALNDERLRIAAATNDALVRVHGASVLGGISSQAFAGLNAVGATNIVESA